MGDESILLDDWILLDLFLAWLMVMSSREVRWLMRRFDWIAVFSFVG